jgi:TRAP-type mannitol/chloroaromatic compound transport system permease large subunit
MMGRLFVLGCFIDPLGIMMITLPVFQPLLGRLDVNLLWFGILFTVNMELSYITPPFGFNLFYMKSVVPSGITMGDIYRSIIPYVFIEIIMIGILIAQPELVLWLPGLMMGR